MNFCVKCGNRISLRVQQEKPTITFFCRPGEKRQVRF